MRRLRVSGFHQVSKRQRSRVTIDKANGRNGPKRRSASPTASASAERLWHARDRLRRVVPSGEVVATWMPKGPDCSARRQTSWRPRWLSADVTVVGQVCQRGERRTLVLLVVATALVTCDDRGVPVGCIGSLRAADRRAGRLRGIAEHEGHRHRDGIGCRPIDRVGGLRADRRSPRSKPKWPGSGCSP